VTAIATILLVEDEPPIRQLMAVALERVGYRVVQARNGVEARERFDETIDLLLTDIRMPYMNGDELIEELRNRRRSLKVLAFSGYAAQSVAPDVVCLSKPFVREELLAAVEAALAR
jgi:CheY-like chemotaxis protein